MLVLEWLQSHVYAIHVYTIPYMADPTQEFASLRFQISFQNDLECSIYLDLVIELLSNPFLWLRPTEHVLWTWVYVTLWKERGVKFRRDKALDCVLWLLHALEMKTHAENDSEGEKSCGTCSFCAKKDFTTPLCSLHSPHSDFVVSPSCKQNPITSCRILTNPSQLETNLAVSWSFQEHCHLEGRCSS